MSSSLARPMLRAPMRIASRRYESTAGNAASKAQQGLSKVTSAAGPAIAGAARGVGNALGRIGGRTGRLINFIQAQTPFVTYYGKVGLELTKLVFQGQKMSPPSMATFQTTYQNLWTRLQSRSISPQSIIQQVRGLGTPQLVAGGVVLAECLGFFTVGEIIGRFKLVGYHGEVAHH
ncbi:ATP synthase subunit g [Beauveria brongniartii RCEF 3172]|uniref:ATP synthase subunit g n=1 Tax=Beauveria brongniartii RCEF 3172 TaxID=1081107 RepID=A0A167CHB7_9HYPO|nr:ATP synthase subunit g [Beauveria brongniartii RCEF 3172]